MDEASYKDFKTSRGYNYHYYRSLAQESEKPVLLLLHGFPSTSRDWKHVVGFFQTQGYGILSPDLLGYGGTDKPTDAESYRMKLMARDVIDILDNERIQRAVVIAHDWGSGLASRLAVYYPDRFIAYAFLALSYLPPAPNYDIDAINAASTEKHGYATFGYFKFFVKDEAPKIIKEHMQSFFSILYGAPGGPGGSGKGKIFCVEGELEKWLLEDKITNSFLSEEELRQYSDEFGKNGFAGPLCWYKAFVFKHTPKDDADIPVDRYTITKPVFFGAALRDSACRPDEGKATTARWCPNATIADYETGHWILQQAPDKLNNDLQAWLKTVLPRNAKL